MNFKTLTNLWRRGGRGSEVATDASGDKGNAGSDGPGYPLLRCSLRKKHQRKHLHSPNQHTMSSLERTQAALLYIQRIVESKQRIYGLSRTLVESNSEECCKATSSLATHQTEETIHSLQQKRKEVIAAVDLCVFEILDQPAISNSDANSVGDRSSGSSYNNRHNDMDKEHVEVTAYDCDEKQKNVAAALVPPPGVDATHASLLVKGDTVSPVFTTATTTHERWRLFLLQLVDILLHIDHTIYNKVRALMCHPNPLQTTSLSPPFSPGKTPSSRTSTSSASPVLNGSEGPTHPAPQETPVTGAVSRERGASVTIGGTCELDSDIKSSRLLKTEKQKSLIMAIVTCVILRTILRHQLGRRAPRRFSEKSSVVEAPLFTAELETTCTIPVPWEEVVAELVGVLDARQKMTVEIIISLWILRHHTGHELVQCVLQNYRCNSSSVQLVKSINSTLHPVGPDAPKASDDQPPLNSAVVEPTVVEPVLMDDIVEQVEALYNENVVLTWVEYLEKRYSSMFEKGGNREGSVSSAGLHSSHMMLTYTVCSPHWSEEKQHEAFQQLREVLSKNLKIVESDDTKEAKSGENTCLFRSVGSAISDHSGMDNGFSPVCSSEGGAEPLVSDTHRASHIVQSHIEDAASVSEVENESISFLSVSDLAGIDTKGVKIKPQEAVNMSLEEDLISFMQPTAWVLALHLRVKQCLNGSTARLEEGQRCACEEYHVALGGLSFSYKQDSLKSLVKTYISVGRYSGALKVAHLHFVNAKKNWLSGSQSQRNGINYLKSMGLLSQAQKSCHKDALVIETAQFALPQAELCEKAINDFSPSCGTCIVRYAGFRQRIYHAKLFHLRESWLAYHHLENAAYAVKYFEQYMELIKFRRWSRRELEAYVALKERGEQLIEEKQYGNAVSIFKQAVESAKRLAVTLKSASIATTTATGSPAPIHDFVSSFLFQNTTGASAGTDATHRPRATECKLELIQCEAESERNLALAYVMQADHEVNVRERRQQLSHAVNSAYAAQSALHRWDFKVNSLNRGVMLVYMASCLVVTAKALLRLDQPKKAALLLEPLIEDKANSTLVRPPLWFDVLLPLGQQTFTMVGMAECIETLRVKISTYDVLTQCLSKFCGERAYQETKRAQEFLQEVNLWATKICADQEKDTRSDDGIFSVGRRISVSTPASVRIAVSKILREVNRLQPILTITAGDSLSSLGRWEDALQEYSNALAMYSVDGEEEASGGGRGLTKKGKERARNDRRMGESRVLVKLAGLYTALEKPKTAIQYYRQVLEYASEMGDALLQYNAYVRLARLYTAIGETEEAGTKWGKVSELAKEYEDQEISRETTRNIVAAQRAARAYRNVLDTAKELNALASLAEGADAASDKCFALEALADAHLQLGQYKECINALNEREKVQDKFGQLNGVLIKMRARALLGDGAAQDAIKVLTCWAGEARLLSNWVEVGQANALLALAYATMYQTLKAKRHHQIALKFFSDASDINPESCSAVIESAHWLVHNFYLNNEVVPLHDCNKCVDKAGIPFNERGLNSVDNGLHDCCVRTTSGNLSVLMLEEEGRLKKPNLKTHWTSGGNEGGCGDEKHDTESQVEKEVLSGSPMPGVGEVLPTVGSSDRVEEGEELDTENNDGNRISGDTGHLNDGGNGSGNNSDTSNSVAKKSELKHSNEDPMHFKDQSVSHSPARKTAMTELAAVSSSWGLSNPLANVSLCKHPAVLEGRGVCLADPLPAETGDTFETSQERRSTQVPTFCFHRALETIEAVAQISLMPPHKRKQLVPRSPADSVDLALLAFPSCTFVFYLAEFATQYVAVVRPANRSFFLKRSVQAYALNDYHRKKSISPKTSPPLVATTTLAEKRASVLSSSLNPIARKGNTTSMEASDVSADADGNSDVVNSHLLQNLQDLYADLWGPIRDSLRMSCCSNDEAECLVLVVDPTLLHVSFPALKDPADVAGPLGQQFTVVVTPTIAQFLYSMRCDDEPSLLNASQQDRCVFLPETVTTTNSSSVGSTQVDAGSHMTASSGGKDAPLTKAEDSSQISSNSIIPWATNTSLPWTVFAGCTRKELISAFELPNCRVLMVLCDPVEHMFKVADGMVRLADMTRQHTSLPQSLDLLVVTNDRTTVPSASEPGVAARLCLHHGCKRVLRVDLPQGKGITPAHQHLLSVFFEKLTLVLEWRIQYPYALALRMAQEEALRCGLEPVVWSSLTLIGAA